MSAVSMKLTPASKAAVSTSMEAASSAVQPSCIVPRQSSETLTPVAPRSRYCIARLQPTHHRRPESPRPHDRIPSNPDCRTIMPLRHMRRAFLLMALLAAGCRPQPRSEEHTSELQSRLHLVC